MSVLKFLNFGMCAALAVLGSRTVAAQTDSNVVAEVGGVKITMTELEQEESSKLLSARYTFYQAETKALDDLVDKRLLEQKAKSENLTVDQLIDRDIKSQVKDPTEDQMKVFYEGLDVTQSYESVREKILEKIRDVRTQKARAEYLKQLRADTTVYVALAPPSSEVDTQGAEVVGPQNAPVKLVEFADYECPYCQKVAADVKKLQADLGDKVALIYKDFPLPMHAHAEKAAEASRCAGKQGKFWEFHDELFRGKELDIDQMKGLARAMKLDEAAFDKCLDSGEEAAGVEKDRKEGVRLGLTGTPSFFINGHFLSGALDYATLRQVVDQQLSGHAAQSQKAETSSPAQACKVPSPPAL
jgi:protein-disulfide isomerase